MNIDDLPDPMKTGEVARLFRVDPKTVIRWAIEGRIAAFKTPGGQRRYPRAAVRALFKRKP